VRLFAVEKPDLRVLSFQSILLVNYMIRCADSAILPTCHEFFKKVSMKFSC